MGIVEEGLIGRGEVAVGGGEIEGIGSSPCQHAAIIKEVVADVRCPPLQKTINKDNKKKREKYKNRKI